MRVDVSPMVEGLRAVSRSSARAAASFTAMGDMLRRVGKDGDA